MAAAAGGAQPNEESEIESTSSEEHVPRRANIMTQVMKYTAKFAELTKYLHFVLDEFMDNVNEQPFLKRFGQILLYAATPRQKNRALITVKAFKALKKPEELTEENIKLINILAWCIQFLEISHLMLDDILDHADTRYGVPCWYKKEGNQTIVDAKILEMGCFVVINKFLSSHPSYAQIMKCIMDVNYKSVIGATIDTLPRSMDTYTMAEYIKMAKYKAGYYTYLLPITLAAHLSQTYTEEVYEHVSQILIDMGTFCQIKDDYLDKGEDIQKGRFTWSVTYALEHATPAQKEQMQEYYGHSDEDSVEEVLELFEQLGIDDGFKSYREETFKDICKRIEKIENKALAALIQSEARELFCNKRYEVY